MESLLPRGALRYWRGPYNETCCCLPLSPPPPVVSVFRYFRILGSKLLPGMFLCVSCVCLAFCFPPVPRPGVTFDCSSADLGWCDRERVYVFFRNCSWGRRWRCGSGGGRGRGKGGCELEYPPTHTRFSFVCVFFGIISCFFLCVLDFFGLTTMYLLDWIFSSIERWAWLLASGFEFC